VIVGYDKAMEQFTQGKINEFIGRKARELYKDQPEILKEFDLCVQKKSAIWRELPYRMFSTDDSRHMRVTFVFVSPNMVITYYDDITKRKMLKHYFMKVKNVAFRPLRQPVTGYGTGIFRPVRL